MRGLALALLLSAASQAASAETLRVGNAMLEFDSARFTVEARSEEGATIVCIAPQCHPRSGRHPAVRITALAGRVRPSCPGEEAEQGGQARRETVMVGSLTFAVLVRQSGCRALSPDFKAACAIVGDRPLRLSTGGLGCSTQAIFPYGMLLELIGGVRPAP